MHKRLQGWQQRLVGGVKYGASRAMVGSASGLRMVDACVLIALWIAGRWEQRCGLLVQG